MARKLTSPVTALAALIGLGLSGCFGGGNAPSELLTLSAPQSPAPSEAAPNRFATVTVPRTPQALSNNRIPVYVSDTVIQYLQDAYWVDEPAELFRNLVSETVKARGSYAIVDPALHTQAAAIMVSGQLLRFGLDPNRMEVVVTFDAAMSRPDQNVATRRFEARVPVAEASRAAVAPALNSAANQVAGQVADWLG